MNILFTSVGRRVSLLKAFRDSMKKSGVVGKIIATDLKRSAPASFVADVSILVPRVDNPDYIDILLDICCQHQVSLLIPLIDTELQALSTHQKRFSDIGVQLLVSSPATNEICFDKCNTAKFFQDIGVKTPRVFLTDELHLVHYPAIVKPATGSCSVGVNKVNNRAELDFFLNYVDGAIIQELILGEEYTIDILIGFDRKIISVVPRLRIETRAGEVSKGITVKNPAIISAAKAVAESLPDAIGCITVQCFLQPDNEIVFIEINPRFGGGYPLSYQAKADFPTWIMKSLAGASVDVAIDEWQEDVVMLRYDDAVFVTRSDIS
jgi:carbamoyl-phosphate synthase large subunit